MKQRQQSTIRRGEGRLIALALALILLCCLAVYLCRLPEREKVEPLHAVSEQALLRAEQVDINHASAAKLSGLPGVGEELAGRIVQYRAEHGPFAKPEDIMNVPGIGEGKLAAMLPHIYLE